MRRALAGLALSASALLVAACAGAGEGGLFPGLEPSVATPAEQSQTPVEQTRRQFEQQHFASMGRAVAVSTSAPEPRAGDTHAIVKVYYGTNRREQRSDGNRLFYTAERSAMTHGKAYVSIPREHRMGRLERAPAWKFWNTDDPESYVVLLSVELTSKSTFESEVAKEVRRSPRRDAFVFVHGYNVSFEDAARRTAQMKYDLGFQGPAAFFSWPSAGHVSSYERDLATMRESIADIGAFLTDFARASGAQTIYLVAHSMGTFGVLNALDKMPSRERGRLMPRLKEIVLAAPDIDREVFVADIMPKIVSRRNRVTLYASSEDRALQLAARVHGKMRLGDMRSGVIFTSGLDTVDASDVDTTLVGHTYYAENRSIISDLFYLIQQGVPPDQRFGLEPVSVPEGTYWRFRR
jgi:esterase/lipase superfamily enzyme